MKKLALFLVSVFVMSGIAFADNDKPIQIGQLPTKAQTFLSWPSRKRICSARATT